MMDLTNYLLSFGGWYFLPTVVAWVQNILYGIFISAGDPKPQPGTPRYILHRKIIHASAVVIYLLYCVYEADWELQRSGDLYHVLGVPVDSEKRKIDQHFRRLSIKYHPDKVENLAHMEQANAFYVHLQSARDVLADPIKRFVYDRLGPDGVACDPKQCKSKAEFLLRGLNTLSYTYGGISVVMVAFHILGYTSTAVWWRYFLVIASLAFEFYTITRRDNPILASLNGFLTTMRLRDPYLPFQLLTMTRRSLFAVMNAITQLAPLVAPAVSQKVEESAPYQHAQLDRLAAISGALERDMGLLQALETVPFQTEEPIKTKLKEALKSWVVENTVASQPQVRDAIGRVRERRRADAPAGARGTK